MLYSINDSRIEIARIVQKECTLWLLVSHTCLTAVLRPVPFVCQVRQCISHMWNIMVKSSLSTSGVAQEVLKCEQQVFAKKL